MTAFDDACWSAPRLARVREHLRGVASMAGMVLVRGECRLQWGDVARRVNVHSIRKSLLHALYGIRVAAGTIHLQATLRELGIDNHQHLNDAESTASVRDLLGSRSGVYHPAVYETPAMRAARPARGSHAPGSFWYYNNWDFNVLGAIYEQLTGTRGSDRSGLCACIEDEPTDSQTLPIYSSSISNANPRSGAHD